MESSGDERSGMRKEIMTNQKNESEGEGGKKMEGIKRGVLPCFFFLSPNYFCDVKC